MMYAGFKKFMTEIDFLDLFLCLFLADALGKIILLMIHEIVMPVLGVLYKGVHASERFITLNGGRFRSFEAAVQAGAKPMGYGDFFSQIVNYMIIVLIVLFIVNKYQKIKFAESVES